MIVVGVGGAVVDSAVFDSAVVDVGSGGRGLAYCFVGVSVVVHLSLIVEGKSSCRHAKFVVGD